MSAAPRFAKVVVEEVQPRCFPGPRSPVFEDRLVQGQVVRVGSAQGDYLPVLLPLGFTGYVHKKFASAPADGIVRTTGDNVSFRYRPRASEVPALLLPKDTPLYYLSEEGDWWRVLFPDAPAFLARGEVQPFPSSNAGLRASWAELEKVRRGRWQDALASRDRAEAEAAALAASRDELAQLTQRFRDEALKPSDEQDLSSVQRALTELLAELPEGGIEHGQALVLEEEIKRQRLLARALAITSEEPVTRDRAAEILEPEVADPLARFDAVGWLRYHEAARGPDYYTLEKGGRPLFLVACSSGRYDLRMFDGVEIGIQGSKSQPEVDRIRELDVLRLEVLQLGRD
ncbi:MAG: hypothetical protein AAF628_37760 [Planctomycetota bacterium]